MSEQPAPDPGSPEAIALGCLCSQGWEDTKLGRLFMFAINRDCALHDGNSAWWQWHCEKAERYAHLRPEVDSAADSEQLETMRRRRTDARRRRRAVRALRRQLDAWSS